MSTKNILLTGEPKSGKSYLLSKLIKSFLKNNKIKMKGIISSELQFNGIRVGIKIKNINKESEKLMAIKIFKNKKYNGKNNKHLGSYQVDVNALEQIALPVFNDLRGCNLLIIDEIGKMELFSKKFEKQIKELFSKKQKLLILAIVPISNDIPLVKKLKEKKDTEVFQLSKTNREGIYQKIRRRVTKFVE
jgi:nucleoside-triphosphatase